MTPAEDIKWNTDILETLSSEELKMLTGVVLSSYEESLKKLNINNKETYFFRHIVGNITTKDGEKTAAYIELIWQTKYEFLNAVRVDFFDEKKIPNCILDRINEIDKTFEHIDNKFIEWNKP